VMAKVASCGIVAVTGKCAHGPGVKFGAPESACWNIQCRIAQWCAPWLRQQGGRPASESVAIAVSEGAAVGAKNAISSVMASMRRIRKV
jgi:hypothetical protein